MPVSADYAGVRVEEGNQNTEFLMWETRVHSCGELRSQYRIFLRTALVAGEGNGTPLQYSCLENPMDGGAW